MKSILLIVLSLFTIHLYAEENINISLVQYDASGNIVSKNLLLVRNGKVQAIADGEIVSQTAIPANEVIAIKSAIKSQLAFAKMNGASKLKEIPYSRFNFEYESDDRTKNRPESNCFKF